MERNRSWNRNRNGNSSNLPHVAGCCRRSRIKLSRLTERNLPLVAVFCVAGNTKKSWINIERSRKRQLDQERERERDRWQKTAFTVALADVVAAVAIDIARLGDVVVVYSCSLIFKRKGKLPTSTTSSGRHTNCASNWWTPSPLPHLKLFLQSASKNNIRFFSYVLQWTNLIIDNSKSNNNFCRE